MLGFVWKWNRKFYAPVEGEIANGRLRELVKSQMLRVVGWVRSGTLASWGSEIGNVGLRGGDPMDSGSRLNYSCGKKGPKGDDTGVGVVTLGRRHALCKVEPGSVLLPRLGERGVDLIPHSFEIRKGTTQFVKKQKQKGKIARILLQSKNA